MRLFHVSENSNIAEFIPRVPDRDDLDKSISLVWAIDEARLPNFLTPRNCPRVSYYIGQNTTETDRLKFFSSPFQTRVIIIEAKWYEAMCSTTLYLYEFDSTDFELQDEVAGYYVAKFKQKPIAKYTLNDLCMELIQRNVEIRIVDNLWFISDEVKASSLNWSLCRMAFAQPRL